MLYSYKHNYTSIKNKLIDQDRIIMLTTKRLFLKNMFLYLLLLITTSVAISINANSSSDVYKNIDIHLT